jgi:peptidoglycan/LPS O-acetylase OafA/YrhL
MMQYRQDSAAVAARSAPGATGSPRHLYAVDVMRFLTVGGVIAAHATVLTSPVTDATGGVLIVVHVTRNVFVLLSAFVLGYSFLSRPASPGTFWRRRYPLIVVPYAVWSLIYALTGGDLGSPRHLVGTYAVDLLDGGAHFHLYFLLLTFQLYLIFPALIGFLGRRPAIHAPLLATSAALQIALTAAIHYGWRPSLLRVWLDHPGSWLPSYQLYIVAGLLAALHVEAVTSWARAHTQAITVAFAASVAVGVISYVVDLKALGYSPAQASAVFQPATVLEAVTATLAQFALGLWVAERLGARRKAQLRATSDASFGVYLAHPLLISMLLTGAGWLGVPAAIATLPSGLIEALVVFGLVPFVYAVTLAAVVLVRRTRLSLALTGRPSRAASPVPASLPLDQARHPRKM